MLLTSGLIFAILEARKMTTGMKSEKNRQLVVRAFAERTYPEDGASGTHPTGYAEGGAPGTYLTYSDGNHVRAVTAMGSNTYGYDNNGNQTSRNIAGSAYTLAYDTEN